MATIHFVLVREDWEESEGTRLLGYEVLGIYRERSSGASQLRYLVEAQAENEGGKASITLDRPPTIDFPVTTFPTTIGRIAHPQPDKCSAVCPVWKLIPQEIQD